jgi:hypothetical protein
VFLCDVPAQLASEFIGRVSRRARGASAFGDPAAPDSICRFAQCIAAVRVLEVGLEQLVEAPQLAEFEATGGAFAPQLAQCAARQIEWLQAVADALSHQFEAAATPRLRSARLSPLLAIAAERRALAAALAGVGVLLEPVLLARVWRLVAVQAIAFIADELMQSHGAEPHAAAALAKESMRECWLAARPR